MRYIIWSLSLAVIMVATTVTAQDAPKAYPITFEADDVHVIAEFSIEANGLKLKAKDVALVPMRCRHYRRNGHR